MRKVLNIVCVDDEKIVLDSQFATDKKFWE